MELTTTLIWERGEVVLSLIHISCEEILNCEALKQVAAWEPLYRELVCEKERGTTKLELSLAESPFEI